MASFGHVAIGMAAGRAFVGRDAETKKVLKAMGAFALLSLWPDLDFIGFVAGIPYEAPLGHRGATHSLIVALAIGAIAYLMAKRWGYPPLKLAILVTLVGMSHGFFDAMTFGGGLGSRCSGRWAPSASGCPGRKKVQGAYASFPSLRWGWACSRRAGR